MTTHFGVKLRGKEDVLKLSADNYIRAMDITNPSVDGLEDKIEKVKTKFELNMKYFKSLSREKFNEELNNFV